MAEHGRNLVVLCDGTNNVWKPGPHKTNVVKLSECLLLDRPERQLRYYDPGVGTAEGYLSEATGVGLKDRVRRAAGLAWADGVWQNIDEAYRFLMSEYEPGDRIFVFGFSRGAFAARAVAGIINLCGLLRPWHENMLPSLIQVYRSGTSTRGQRASRAQAGAEFRKNFGAYGDGPEIHFIGVWDTVESVGLGQLVFETHITSDPSVKPRFTHVRHAVALDELRWPYSPRLYTGRRPGESRPGETYKQVWFCGSHCDVGGSEAEAGLSNAALRWMVLEANEQGLLIDEAQLATHAVNPFDLQHDETAALPLWSVAWTFKRDYEPKMVVHESVDQRMNHPRGQYRPPIGPDYTVERTRDIVTLADGSTRKLPLAPAPVPAMLRKVGVKSWHWLWLSLSAAVTAVLALNAHPNGSVLAVDFQLTRGWTGALGSALAAWSEAAQVSVSRLLEYDFLFILAYATLVPIVIFFALRFENPSGYPAPGTAKWLGFCGGWLPVADVLENILTLWAAHWHGGACETYTCTGLGALVSLATSVASLLKFGLLIGFVCALLVSIGIGMTRTSLLGRKAQKRPAGSGA